MNERIRELSKQADEYADTYCDTIALSYSNWNAIRDTKFAQLIVRKCIGVVEGGSFLHDQAPTAIFARECSVAIKQHFGVEE